MQTSDAYKLGFALAIKLATTMYDRQLSADRVGMTGGMADTRDLPESPAGTPQQSHRPANVTSTAPQQATEQLTDQPHQLMSERSPDCYN
jgi:hypothetical protein